VGVALAGTVVFATIRDNLIFAPFGIQAPPPAESGETPVFASAELRITDNFLVCERTGLLFDRRSMFVGTTRLSANTIGACRTGGIRVLGLAAPGASVIIAHNNLNVRSTGIMAAVDALLIEGNRVAFTEEDGGGDPVSGIALISGLDPDGPNQCQILANQIAGFSGPGISNRTAAPALIIKQNIIERCGSGIESFHDGSAGSAAIENNTLVDIELAGFEGPAVLGIAVSGIDSATIAGNTIRRLGTQPKSASMRLGIGAQAVRALALTGNAIFDVAPAGDFVGIAGGILLVAPYGEAEVALNQVARDSNPATEASRSLWVALGSLAEAALAGTPVKLGALAAVRLDDGRSVVLGSARPFVVSAINLPESRAGGRITARGNRLQARGGAQAVEITVADACVFADNHCELLGTNPRVPSVRLEAESMAVTANRVRGGEPSMQLAVDIKRMTVVGNITANPISANGPLPAPWNELNVTA
jgi:hypothetical protein